MSITYYDRLVPIPNGGRERKDNNPARKGRTVIVEILRTASKQKEIRIGVKADEPGLMHPNDKYYLLYDAQAGANTAQGISSTALHTAVWAIAEKLKIAPLLVRIYGTELAHGILDRAALLLSSGCGFDSDGEGKLGRWNQDTHALRLISRSSLPPLSPEVCTFLSLWSEEQRTGGVSEVYLYSGPCGEGQEEPAEEDAAPDGNSADAQTSAAVSFLWVIAASGPNRGMPLAYITCPGVQAGPAEMQRAAAKLVELGYTVAECLLDDGHGTEETLQALSDMRMPFLMRLPEDAPGHSQMLSQHADQIRRDPKYYTGNGYFGITDQIAAFQASPDKSCTALLYSPVKGSHAVVDLTEAVYRTAEQIRQALKAGEAYTIPQKYQPFLSVSPATSPEDSGSPSLEVQAHCKALNAVTHTLGFTSVVSSLERSAGEIQALYALRESPDLANQCYALSWGEETKKDRAKDSPQAVMFPCFLAAAVFHELRQICSSRKLHAADMISDLAEVQYRQAGSAPASLPKSVKVLWKELKIPADASADFLDTQHQKTPRKRRAEKPHEVPHPSWSFTLSPDAEMCRQDALRGTGVDAGIAVGAESAASGAQSPAEPKHRGRKKGSKDKKPRKRRASAKPSPSASSAGGRNRRGRPLGSRDSKPRTRRTNAELGKTSKGSKKETLPQ